MDIDVQKEDGVVVLRPAGRLDVSNAPHLQQAAARILGEGAAHVVLDFSDVAYISSVGLATCLKIGKHVKSTDRRTALCSLQDMVAEVFEVSGFLALFDIHASRAEAVEDLRRVAHDAGDAPDG